MDIEIKKKKYLVPRKYWPWIGGGVIVIALLVWLAQSNFTSTLQVDTRGLSIATVTAWMEMWCQFRWYRFHRKKVAPW